MKNVIYYFSGTGNSLRAARIIAKNLGGATLISMREGTPFTSAKQAEVIGFVCPVYEWDVPETVKKYIQQISVNPNAYIFMIATYIGIHGRCFETVASLLEEKGCKLSYGKALRCVASQCIAYEPFPPAKIMVPFSEKCTQKIGKKITKKVIQRYPKMSPLTRKLYPKMMVPFLNVEHEFDKGFYVNDKCVGCEVCRKVCPCDNITFEDHHPVWNHACLGCASCVAYCPTKAIQYTTPPAYVALNNAISKKMGLPDKRTRYHNPYIKATDLMENSETIDATILNSLPVTLL